MINIFGSLILQKTVGFGMVYVDFAKHTTKMKSVLIFLLILTFPDDFQYWILKKLKLKPLS